MIGDMPLAIAVRKELIVRNLLDPQSELKLIELIFPRHPKAPSLWQHRRWCLNRLEYFIEKCQIPVQIINNELRLCSHLCDIYPKNYYAWCHRLWLARMMPLVQVRFPFRIFVIGKSFDTFI